MSTGNLSDSAVSTARVDTIRHRWDGLGPWYQQADTPWGSCVVHADFGEAYIGTQLHTTPPTEKWTATARDSAEARRSVMCRVAGAISAAPEDIALLLGEIDRLNALIDAAGFRG